MTLTKSDLEGSGARVVTKTMRLLTPRWYPLRPHPGQVKLVRSNARYKINPAGRRSGKTERLKRGVVRMCGQPSRFDNPMAIIGAPTRDHAKRLYWNDLKAMVPRWMLRKDPSESELLLQFWNGWNLRVVGMDKPYRIEGEIIDFIGLDEMADMKPGTWPLTVRPALDTLGRPGKAWLIGKPKGRNAWWDLWKYAISEESGPDWLGVTWTSEEILTAAQIREAKKEMGPQEYAQEYLAQFVNFEGRAYYTFDREIHAVESLRYDPDRDLVFAFDFNRSPGIAVVSQDQPYSGVRRIKAETPPDDGHYIAPWITAVIGEVFIPGNSTTRTVCQKLIDDWGPEGRNHQGRVLCYGDATGGAAGSQGVAGSNWDIIREMLGRIWGQHLKVRVPRGNPRQVVRVNALNHRIMDSEGRVSLLVDPIEAPHGVDDLEEVTWLKGTNELDKPTRGQESKLTHWSDGLGYQIFRQHPIRSGRKRVVVTDM